MAELGFIEPLDYKLILKYSPDAYLILSPDFRIVEVSDNYAAATKIEREKVLGRALFEVFPNNPDDPTANGSQQLRASLERVMETRRDDIMAVQKYDIRRPDSEGGGFEERYWAPLNKPAFDEDGRIRLIIHKAEDVTELVRLKREGILQKQISDELRSERDQLEKVRQGQRMEAMGQLAGGVAHDFNNILASIILECDSCLEAESLPEPARSSFNLIKSASEKAASLTRQLLAFSRKQVLQPKVLNLNTVARDMHKLLSRLFPEDIALQMNLADDLANALIDPGQVEQILLNLATNARDAIGTRGKITISTANVTLDKGMSSGNMTVKPGRYVMMSVQDTGVGMSAQTQARLFEPFFTTKGIGKGTGLGLATVYGIVNQNNGTIWVYSEPQKGSVFKVYLPLIDEQPVQKSATSEPMESKSLAGKMILVVEDDDALRRPVCEALRKTGYVVHEVSNGRKALDFLKNFGATVDLIISDLIMPEMGGKELAHNLKKLGIKSKVLFFSGYTEDVLSEQGVSGVPLEFLEKPFSRADLLAKVKSVLSA